MIRLLRNVNNNAVVEWTTDKNSNTKYVELTEDEVHGYFGYSAAKAGTVLRLDPKVDGITLYTTSTGIGDAVCVLYAACGLAAAGYKVTYNTRHHKWIEWAYHDNLTVRPLSARENVGGVDVNQDYQDQLWETYIGRLKARPYWAYKALRKAYPSLPEDLEPKVPPVIHPDPIEGGEYIVLSPFSSIVGPSRDWPTASYARLAHKLVGMGKRVFVTMTSEHKSVMHLFDMPGVKVWLDRKPEDVVRLLANSRLLVGNDSGPAHLGGLYRVPTYAIMAIVYPSVTFLPATTVQGIVPNPRVECRFCHWQKEGGIIPACGTFCGAIATITPEDVLTDLMVELGKPGSIAQSSQEL